MMYAFIAFIAAVVSGYLARSAKNDFVANDDGRHLLRMNKLYYIVGIIGVAIGSFWLIGPALIVEDDPGVSFYIIMIVVALLIGLLGLMSILYFKKHYVLYDDSGLEVSSFRGKVKVFNWEDIIKAKFNHQSGLVTIVNNKGEKVKVHYHLIGFRSFIEFFQTQTKLKVENGDSMY
jgi:hypothetical protein